MPIFDNWNANTTLAEAIGQAVDAASTCWENLGETGRFDSVRASDIVRELNLFIGNRIDQAVVRKVWSMDEDKQDVEVAVNPQEPYLGLATTEQLFREIIARFTLNPDIRAIDNLTRFTRALTLSEMLGGLTGPEKEYRTVDSY